MVTIHKRIPVNLAAATRDGNRPLQGAPLISRVTAPITSRSICPSRSKAKRIHHFQRCWDIPGLQHTRGDDFQIPQQKIIDLLLRRLLLEKYHKWLAPRKGRERSFVSNATDATNRLQFLRPEDVFPARKRYSAGYILGRSRRRTGTEALRP